jgi:hypothetical protein
MKKLKEARIRMMSPLIMHMWMSHTTENENHECSQAIFQQGKEKKPGGDQSQNRENVYLLSLREVGSQEV